MHNITKHPVCLVCGNNIVKFNNTTGYRQYCSTYCSNNSPDKKQQISDTNNTRYGGHPRTTDTVKAKYKKTCLIKYGVEYPTQNEIVKAKARETNMNLYGTEYHQQSDSGKYQRQSTNQRLYGVDFPLQSKAVQQVAHDTIMYKYGVTSTSKLDYVKHKQQEHRYDNFSSDVLEKLTNKEWLINQHHTLRKPLQQIATELGLKDEKLISTRMLKFSIDVRYYAHSYQESQITDFLAEHNIKFVTGNRQIIAPHELDIFLPDYNVAIEYNGLYWHSDKFKTPNFHKEKLDRCTEHKIRLLTIFSDEWIYQTDIIKQKILHIIQEDHQNSIFARKTIIVPLEYYQKREFFEKYHIQGDGPGSISYGLKYKESIVAAITFIKQSNGTFVLNRYATSTIVPGGFSKLISHFCNNHTWKQIITFADCRWSVGELYVNNGFVFNKLLKPDYYYIENNKRVHKFNYRRKFLSKKLQNFDPLLSERVNCDINGCIRIWDCGKIRFIKSNLMETIT
jgi:hypothetical protein